MNKILSEKEIGMISELVAEMKKEASDKLSLEENMQISLAGRVEEVDEKKEVEELCKGIHDFDELLTQMGTDGEKAMIIETLERSGLADKSKEEQYALLAEGMEALKADLAGKGYDLGELQEVEIKKDGDITEEDLHVIKNAMAEYLGQFALLHGETEVMENFFRAFGEDVLEKLLEAYEDDEEKYYMALAIHILQLQGKLEPVPVQMGARGIGASVSAMAASAKVHVNGILGKISSKEVINLLKKIAAAILTILVAVAVAAVAFKVGQFFALMMFLLLGYGVIGTITALVFGGIGVIMTAGALIGLWEDAKEAAESAKEYVVEKLALVKKWVVETAIPELKSFWENLKNKISCFLSSDTETKTEETVEEPTAESEIMEEDCFA